MGKSKLLSEIVSGLYQISRICGKSASTANTVNTILTGSPEKIAKNLMRKSIYKTSSKLAGKVAKKV